MAETRLLFLTAYKEDMLNSFKIYIAGVEQSEFFNFMKGEYHIYINEVILQKNMNGDISNIDIMIQSKEKEEKSNIYKFRSNSEKDNIIFLFDYKLDTFSKQLHYINTDSLFFWKNEEKYINKYLPNEEKYSLFYDYLINKLDENNTLDQYFIKLINSFIRTKEKEDSNYTIPIDIGISIIIIYKECLSQCIPLIKRINKNLVCNNININSNDNESFFLNGVTKCLHKLENFNNDDKNLITEILLIYFIKYRNKDIEFLLTEKYINILIDLFKEKNLYFLDEEYLTDEICQKIINKIPEIKNIVDILSKSNDYISYINRINQNFSNIFKAIEQLKSLKGIFKVHFKVSQNDKIKELVKLHKELITKQEKKGKYFISFISIIEDYYNLYIDNENLEDLSELLIMINLESEKFPKINKIKTLKNNILIKIRYFS